ncbi:MAG: TetR/AcrR family transcriptional regulator [Acidobacteriota bacterium]|nr:TetR/AcrR family transcriptional regulator [Acidobacteriota bacterium]
MSKRRDTRNEILQLALELFLTRGYNGFSYQDLADRLGIRKASIHYHFPSKEDLAVAMIADFREELRNWSRNLEAKDAAPGQKLDALFETYRQMFRGKDQICMVGACSAEWNTLADPVRAEMGKVMKGQRQWLVDVIEQGRETGEFAPGTEALPLARFVYAGMQGALQLARVSNDETMLDLVIKQLNDLVRGNVAAETTA